MSEKAAPPVSSRRLRIVVSNEAVAPAAGSAPAVAVKGLAPRLAQDSSLDDAAELILSACIEHFTANIPALQETSDPEAIHQMRVALRRLRAAIGFLRRAIASDELEMVRKGASEIASALGEARDWDVFREGLEPLREFLGEEPSYFALIDAAELQRRRAHEKARRTIGEDTTAQFIETARRLIAERSWRGEDKWLKEGSARKFAATALHRLHRRATARAADLASLSLEQRHEARIAFKKLRYAAEFFQSLFDAPRAPAVYIKSVARLQERLGADNDMAVALRLLHVIDQSGDAAQSARAAGFVQGWRAHALENAHEGLKTSAKDVRALHPFWR